MLGTEEFPGNMMLTLKELFNKIDSYSSERDYNVKLSYLEIYNENIRDLLSPNSEENLELREDPAKGLSISGITELAVNSPKDVMYQLRKGNKNRTVESTNANETSSRSHAILQVLIEYKEKNPGMHVEIKFGKLSLIDLAGSERASATHNRGIRLIEGANINRSLLALGNCINALCEANEKGTKPHIPFRDSKLTRLLKDSLGGNSRTVMIANVSPAASTFEDTYNTLKYANRAKNIKTHVNRNVLNVQYHISNYTNIINNLKSEIVELKSVLAKKENPSGNGLNNSQINNQKVVVDKCVHELKSFFDEEISLKIRLFEQEESLIFNQRKLFKLKEDKLENQSSELLLEKENKIGYIKKEIELTEERISELQRKRDQMFNSYLKLFHPEKKDIYSDFLTLFLNSQKSKLDNIENHLKNKNYSFIIKQKDNMIKELEYQLKLRDELLKCKEENNLIKENNEIKSITQIRNDYDILPIINNNLPASSLNTVNCNKKNSDNVIQMNLFNHLNNLPLIYDRNNKLNLNLNKEKRAKEQNNLYNINTNNLNNINNNNNYNSNNNNNNFEKDRKLQIASANEKVRNNRQLSQNPTQLTTINNNMNNIQIHPSSKEINTLNRKINSSKKPKANNKIINFKNKNDQKEESSNKRKKKYETSSTEKSNISNLSQPDNIPNTNNNISNNHNINIFHLDEPGDLDKSHSKDNAANKNQNRQNIFKEKELKDLKKNHGSSESPQYNPSPIKKDFPKLYSQQSNNLNNLNILKKKELNNFLYDRSRQNKSKKPFKI